MEVIDLQNSIKKLLQVQSNFGNYLALDWHKPKFHALNYLVNDILDTGGVTYLQSIGGGIYKKTIEFSRRIIEIGREVYQKQWPQI